MTAIAPSSTPSTGSASASSFTIPETTGSSVTNLLIQLRDGDLQPVGITPAPTGFDPLDSVFEGGFLPGEVILLGGQPGAGKTISALQWSRNLALADRRVSFACFEHDESTMLNRLLIQELATVAEHNTPTERIQARTAIRNMMLGLLTIRQAVDISPLVGKALLAVERYAPRLQLLRASSQRTTVDDLEAACLPHLEPGSVLVVDYLQKLPVPDVPNVDERVYRAVEMLKELAIAHQIAVIALSAAHSGGIGIGRLRLEHLRGSDALAHECDIALLMNHKLTATSDRHLKYDLTQLDEARRRTIFSVEKNRRGEVDVHVEFERDFANFRFKPQGAFVSEALAGD